MGAAPPAPPHLPRKFEKLQSATLPGGGATWFPGPAVTPVHFLVTTPTRFLQQGARHQGLGSPPGPWGFLLGTARDTGGLGAHWPGAPAPTLAHLSVSPSAPLPRVTGSPDSKSRRTDTEDKTTEQGQLGKRAGRERPRGTGLVCCHGVPGVPGWHALVPFPVPAPP